MEHGVLKWWIHGPMGVSCNVASSSGISSTRASLGRPKTTAYQVTRVWRHFGKQQKTHGYGSIPIDTFLVGWTSINPSYFGVHWVPGFWSIPTWQSWQIWDHLRSSESISDISIISRKSQTLSEDLPGFQAHHSTIAFAPPWRYLLGCQSMPQWRPEIPGDFQRESPACCSWAWLSPHPPSCALRDGHDGPGQGAGEQKMHRPGIGNDPPVMPKWE